MRPNVLLVVLDAARRDSLEPYGAPTGSSPVVAQLARAGVALPEVYSTACWTAPSHTAMFTGLMQRAAGVARAPGGTPSGVKPVLQSHRDRLLPEVMRRAGYATGAVSANLWVSEASGFATGFDKFQTVDSGRVAQSHRGGVRARMRWSAEAARGRVDDGAAEIENVFRAWLGQKDDRPFFWFVNLIECHSPYLPPRPYGGVSNLDRLRAAEDARRYYTLTEVWRACLGGLELSLETLDRMRRLYAASIRYMDDWLARLIDSLDRAAALEDTIVIVTADHGENFGEAGLIAHGMSIDNRLIHVPFVVSGPRVAEADINSLASLPRFVAESTGLDNHPWHDDPPAGVGLAQFDPPVTPDDPRARELIDGWGLGEDAFRRFTTPLECAVSGDLKLMRRLGEELVFDLAKDPLELSPLTVSEFGPERGDALAALRSALDHPAMTAVASPRGAPAEPSAEELSEIEDRMRMLGYM